MMGKLVYLTGISVFFLISACSIIQSGNKESFAEGRYFIKEKGKQNVFINMTEINFVKNV